MNRNAVRKASLARSLTLALFAAVAGQAAAQPTVKNGVLSIDTGPGDQDLRIAVGAPAGRVQVFGLVGTPDGATFWGIRAVNLTTGAGNDKLQFDIDSSQSLGLVIDTGSGTTDTKIDWKIPAGAVTSAVATLEQRSGGGSANTEFKLESAVPDLQFGWQVAGGGGNKSIKAAFDYLPGMQWAANELAFDLGGGTHDVSVETKTAANNYGLKLDAGYANTLLAKVESDAPTSGMNVAVIATAPKTDVEVTSGAQTVNLALGGNYGPYANEVNYTVKQTRAGTVTATLTPRGGVVADRVTAKFDGASGRLALGGLINTMDGPDSVLIESTMTTSSTLTANLGAGPDRGELLFKAPLTLPLAGYPRVLGGAGDDNLVLVAERGSTGRSPRIDCGPGIDTVRGFGTIANCEVRN